MAAGLRSAEKRRQEFDRLNLGDRLVFGFSWLLVMGIGVLPIFEGSVQRPPSISTPAIIVFLTAVASGAALRRRYDWIGLVLHIFGQILIWLSLFSMSLALALYLHD